MRTLANDEIETDADMTKDRFPTVELRLREIDGARMLLEQHWRSPFVNVDDAWIPIPSVANPVVRGATESRTSPPRCSTSEFK